MDGSTRPALIGSSWRAPARMSCRSVQPGQTAAQPRPHRLDVGVYDREDDTLVRRQLVAVETSGLLSQVGDMAAADLLLVNDEDLTFASTRPDNASRATLLNSAGLLPSAISRAVAVTTAWDMLMTGDVSAKDFVGCVNGVLRRETADSVVEPFFRLAVLAAERWAPDALRRELLSSVADVCLALADHPERRRAALRTLARAAVGPEQLEQLRRAAADDIDLRWRALMRSAELGEYDQAEVEALAEQDPDPEAWVRALAAQAARPDPTAKQRVWEVFVEKHEVPMGSIPEARHGVLATRTGRTAGPVRRELPGCDAYHARGRNDGGHVGLGFHVPVVRGRREVRRRPGCGGCEPGVSPLVRRNVIELTDRLRRMLRSRGGA